MALKSIAVCILFFTAFGILGQSVVLLFFFWESIYHIPHVYPRHRSGSSTVLGIYARLCRSHAVYEK